MYLLWEARNQKTKQEAKNEFGYLLQHISKYLQSDNHLPMFVISNLSIEIPKILMLRLAMTNMG